MIQYCLKIWCSVISITIDSSEEAVAFACGLKRLSTSKPFNTGKVDLLSKCDLLLRTASTLQRYSAAMFLAVARSSSSAATAAFAVATAGSGYSPDQSSTRVQRFLSAGAGEIFTDPGTSLHLDFYLFISINRNNTPVFKIT